MPAENSVEFIYPLASFLIVFIFSFALFSKTEILSEKRFLNLFISFLISSLFLTAGNSIGFITTLVPLFAVLVVGLFLVLTIAKFTESDKSIYKGIGIAFLALLGFFFILAAAGTFLEAITSAFTLGSSYPPIVTNSFLFIIIGGGVGWFIVRK